MTERPVLLGGYAAMRCARRVHNDWDATIHAEPSPVSADQLARFELGIQFEAEVRVRLQQSLGDRCLLIERSAGRVEAIGLTVAGMDAGAEVIVGGWLPDDPAGHRTGRPDVLLRVSGPGEDSGYVAGDIKAHRASQPSAGVVDVLTSG